MPNATHTIADELKGVTALIAVLWVVFLLDWIIPVDFNRFGLEPRSLFGAIGIVTMPFLHRDVAHLAGNTIPLFILLTLLAGSKARSWEIVGEIVLVGGVLLWLFGRNATHVGASGLVFGLIAFLILSGLLERRVVPLIVALLVAFLYGGTLLSGVLPTVARGVSWDGHLCGAIAGGLSASFLHKETRREEEDAE